MLGTELGAEGRAEKWTENSFHTKREERRSSMAGQWDCRREGFGWESPWGPPGLQGEHTSPKTQPQKRDPRRSGSTTDEERLSKESSECQDSGERAEHIKENGQGQKEAMEEDMQIAKGLLRPTMELGPHPKGHEMSSKHLRQGVR